MARVYLSVGSNVNRRQNIALALTRLKQLFDPLRLSAIYESAPVDGKGAAYYNLVVGFDTAMAPEEIREELRKIEGRLERRRDDSGQVSIDIDLLLHGDRQQVSADFSLPHPDLQRYRHVLQPLAELAPDLRLPGREHTLAQLLAGLNLGGELRKVGESDHRP